MRQIVRLNVVGQGYSLYSFDARGMRREPLDVASETVPREYIATQRRLDELFAISEGPWSMTFRSSEAGGCVLAYGCKIGGADQMGRSGLILVHGLLLESPRELPACVLGILSLLSPTRVGHLAESIQDVAQGNLPAQKLLDWLVNHWAKDTITAREIYTHGPNSIRDKKTTLGLAQILVERGWLVPVNTHQRNMRAWKIVRRSALIAGAAGAAPGAATTFCSQAVDKYLLF